ncbi:MAG: DUF4157 domain-containing protein [Bacteroidota bacterium]
MDKRTPVIQAKLTVGQPNDRFEQEADQVADAVMKESITSVPQVQRKCEACEEEELQMKPLAQTLTPIIQKQEEEEEEILQMKGFREGHSPTNGLQFALQRSKGGGQQMDISTQNFMSNRIGADFSGVKIHTNANAVQMNRQLNAKAFTHGRDVYFNSGQYRPYTNRGKHLLAHELTHTIQQGAVSNVIMRSALPERTAAQQIATSLRNAAKGWGTDEDAIFNALTGRTPALIASIEAAYLALSGGQTLEAMLRDELGGNDLSRALSLLRGETPFTEIARTLWDAMRGWGTDESAIYGAIAGRTAVQWTEIQNAYRQMTGNNLLADLRDELTANEWSYAQTLLPGAPGGAVTDEDRATVVANQLEAAMQGWGTDESAIYAALTGHTQAELREIERRYRLLTGRELNVDLRDELNDREYERAQQLLHSLPLAERIARSIHNAVKGIGTREAEIVAILQGRTAAEITQAGDAYRRLFNESMNDRLQDELGGSDWLETSILLSGRMPNVLEEIIISTMGWGTDRERLFAALESLGGDAAIIRQLKKDYRARTGNNLRSLLIDELSGTHETRALALILDNPMVETADEMEAMSGEEAAWTPSGPTGAVGSTSGNDFADWASAASEHSAPKVLPSTTINCWEMVMLAAYRVGALSWRWIHELYTTVPISDWPDRMSSSRTAYTAGDAIPRGNLVFFDGVAHVALATGNPDEVLTFWPPPDFASYSSGTVDEVKVRKISALVSYMAGHPMMGTPVVEYGPPSW